MDITTGDGLWRLTWGQIENRKTGQVKCVSDMPNHNVIAMMAYQTLLRKCKKAFDSGVWPS